MAETPQPTTQVEAAPPPPTPEAPAAGTNGEATTNNVTAGINLESQIKAAEAAGESSDQAQVDTFTNLANRGSELTTDSVDGELHAMIDQENATSSGAAPEQTTTPDEQHNDVDALQSQLDDLNNKSTDELQQMANGGGAQSELAKQRLESMGIKTENPTPNDGTQTQEGVTPSVQPEVPGEKPPLAEETGESVVSAAEQITKDAAEGQTPTQPEAATAENQSSSTSETPTAPQAPEGQTEAAPTAPEASETTSEEPQSPEQAKTPEQEAQELKIGRDKLVAKFAREYPNMDLSSEAVQAYLDMASESKENMDAVNGMHEQFLGAEAQKTAEKMGIDTKEFAKGSVDGIIQNIEQQLDALKKALAEGDQSKAQEVQKKSWLVRILKGFAKFMLEVAKDVAAGVAVYAQEAGKHIATAGTNTKK